MPKRTEAAPGLSGRRGQAKRNDAVILRAAREVFLDDPKAPIAAVAERAGVGISALYRRYAGKEDLLRRLCHDGLLRFIAEAEAAAADPDGWRALTGFLERVVEADVHSLTVRLAGTFTPTSTMQNDAQRAASLAAALVDRAHASGRLRRDVVVDDIDLLLEGCAAVRVPDPARTRQLRQRYLALLLDGLASADGPPQPGPPQPGPPQPGPPQPGLSRSPLPGSSRSPLPGRPSRRPLPGPPPRPQELNWRWRQEPA